MFGKFDERGDGATGEGGDWPDDWLWAVPVELVDGLSELFALSARDCKKALNIVDMFGCRVASPKVVELSLT